MTSSDDGIAPPQSTTFVPTLPKQNSPGANGAPDKRSLSSDPRRPSAPSGDQSSSPVRLRVRGLWKVFGPRPAEILNSPWRQQSREEILAATGHVVAVRDVDMDVREGETFVVMGLSGSGKSTLVRCLIRLVEPSEGTIEISGHDVRALSERDLNRFRHRIGMVFQHFGLLPHRNVLQNVTWGLEVQHQPRRERERIGRDMLRLVGLEGWENHPIHELSGGMQQRVGLARALAVDPDVLLMDEPFSALDPVIRRELQAELQELQSRLRKTIVFITHDLHEAMKLGDRIAIMKDGEFVQVGTPQDIVQRPANDYVRSFTADLSAADPPPTSLPVKAGMRT